MFSPVIVLLRNKSLLKGKFSYVCINGNIFANVLSISPNKEEITNSLVSVFTNWL